MQTTVLSFYNAIAAAHEPREYTYLREAIPFGNYEVTLDFMIWSKKQVGINCYCTIKETGLKVILPVYRNEAEEYLAGSQEMRFVVFGTELRATVDPRGEQGVILKDAIIVKR
ncbi:hypothetical protein [Mucilaginibacter sp. OK098]|uniref:hypothetical protein n=1 Tax=Mucilaginibacter sp. OK098 TaxID=1855297 RepID=UPI00091B3171|nr:hypothetical protein [Mucilaginibacter sp. OK098]SHL95634.1 hypothetical protein SAMN05216524_101310 [Mucilaginibacter sp. OK098]